MIRHSLFSQLKLLAVLTGLVLACSTQANNRQIHNFDFALLFPYDYSTDIDFNGPADADIQGNHGFGLGLGYTWNDQITTRFDMTSNHRRYTATRVADDDSGDKENYRSRLDSVHLQLGLDYYFVQNRPWAPFVGVTAGWDFFDTNIPSGPPSDYCWWDPWWGYICGRSQPTYTETAWQLGWNAGMRFDLGRRHFARILYGERHTDINTADRNARFAYSRIELGWSY